MIGHKLKLNNWKDKKKEILNYKFKLHLNHYQKLKKLKIIKINSWMKIHHKLFVSSAIKTSYYIFYNQKVLQFCDTVVTIITVESREKTAIWWL